MVPSMEVSCCIDQDFSRVGLPAPEPLYEVRHSASPSPVIQTLPDRAERPPLQTRALTVHIGEAAVGHRAFSPCSEIVINEASWNAGFTRRGGPPASCRRALLLTVSPTVAPR